MQIVIKPEAADASTQTSPADQDATSAPSESIPSSIVEAPPEAVETRKPRRKKKTLGKAYAKGECDCENCRASDDEDRPGLESITNASRRSR